MPEDSKAVSKVSLVGLCEPLRNMRLHVQNAHCAPFPGAQKHIHRMVIVDQVGFAVKTHSFCTIWNSSLDSADSLQQLQDGPSPTHAQDGKDDVSLSKLPQIAELILGGAISGMTLFSWNGQRWAS